MVRTTYVDSSGDLVSHQDPRSIPPLFVVLVFVVPQELAALQEELARMRRKAEDDRRAVAQAELEQTKQASQAREKTRELEGRISALKARLCRTLT